MQKTPFVIDLKRNRNQTAVQINDIHTSQPIVDASFTVNYGDQSYQGTTDEHGFLLISTAMEEVSSDISMMIVKDSIETRLSELQYYEAEIEKGDDSWVDYGMNDSSWGLFGITDKPIYRPGETVRFNVYIRQKKDTRFVIPSAIEVLKIFVSSDYLDCWENYQLCQSFYVKEIVDFNAFGSFSDEFVIPQSTTNRNFKIDFIFKRVDEDLDYKSTVEFQVSDFKNSDYRLELATESVYASGQQPVPIVARAFYYSGGIVDNGLGEIAGSIVAKDIRDSYPDYQDYYFGEFDAYAVENFKLENLKFDINGEMKVGYHPPQNSVKFGELKLNAGLKPHHGEWNYSPSILLPYYQHDYFLGLKLNSWLLKVNQPITLESVLIDFKGTKHSPENIRYSIQREEAVDRWSESSELICDIATLNHCEFTVPQAGQYRLLVSSQMNAMHFRQDIIFHVFDAAKTPNRPIQPRIVMVTDKKIYDVGDQARVTMSVPFPESQVLVTIERNNILNKWRKATRQGELTIEFEITEKHVPGFDITALIRSADSANSYRELAKIDNQSLTIAVNEPKQARLFLLHTNQPNYEPKDTVTLEIESQFDTESDYTIAVIDQSIVDLVEHTYLYSLDDSYYSQSKYYWGLMESYQIGPAVNVSRFKFSRFPSRVTVITRADIERMGLTDLGDLLRELPARDGIGVTANLVQGKPRLLPISSLRKLGSFNYSIGNLSIPARDLRSKFAETALFKTDVRIAAKATRAVEFQLPDNMTQWKIIVMGADLSGRLEINDIDITASKVLELRSTLPLQVTQGDRFSADYAVVSKIDGKINIQSAVKIEQNSEVQHTVDYAFSEVERQESHVFSLPVDTKILAPLELTALVKSKNAGDGLYQSIPVSAAEINGSLSQYGQFDTVQHRLHFSRPENLGKSAAELSIHVSASLMSYLNPIYIAWAAKLLFSDNKFSGNG